MLLSCNFLFDGIGAIGSTSRLLLGNVILLPHLSIMLLGSYWIILYYYHATVGWHCAIGPIRASQYGAF